MLQNTTPGKCKILCSMSSTMLHALLHCLCMCCKSSLSQLAIAAPLLVMLYI